MPCLTAGWCSIQTSPKREVWISSPNKAEGYSLNIPCSQSVWCSHARVLPSWLNWNNFWKFSAHHQLSRPKSPHGNGPPGQSKNQVWSFSAVEMDSPCRSSRVQSLGKRTVVFSLPWSWWFSGPGHAGTLGRKPSPCFRCVQNKCVKLIQVKNSVIVVGRLEYEDRTVNFC